jgi:NAD(P)-dependent dehydrogenase (short-subunit alcohol dehydrogenase family)
VSKTWLVTGASSGFGALLAERVASEGDQVIAVARRGDRLRDLASAHPGHVTPVPLDLTSSQAGPTIDAAVRLAGGLDVLVNNAGYGQIGSIEQCDDSAARAQFDINFFAALTVLRTTLPALRASGGRIVQIASFLSQVALAGSGVYSASKSALQLSSEAMALELAPAGVHVTTIHPGHFATEFVSAARVVAPDTTYASTVGTTLSDLATRPAEAWGDPNWVVEAVLAVVAHPQPPSRVAVGSDAVQAMRMTMQSQLTELAAWEAVQGLSF